MNRFPRVAEALLAQSWRPGPRQRARMTDGTSDVQARENAKGIVRLCGRPRSSRPAAAAGAGPSPILAFGHAAKPQDRPPPTPRAGARFVVRGGAEERGGQRERAERKKAKEANTSGG